MRWLPVISFCILAGCARGVVLKDQPSDPSKAAYIEVISGDKFFIQPARGSDPEQELKSPGLWVSDGWFAIDQTCYHPKNRPDNGYFNVIQGAEPTVHFLGGHRYTLQCDPNDFGKMDLVDTTSGDTSEL